MIIHTLSIVPPPRDDDVSWTRVRVEQASTQTGSYTTVATVNLDQEIDPAAPAPQGVSFASSLADGWFRFTFLDAAGNTSPTTDPVQDGGTHIDWAPSLSDVGGVINARTKGTTMARLGTFTTDTQPTADQVSAIILKGVNAVSARVGPVANNLKGQARDAAALYAAMMIELSYWPEQIRENRSPYDALKALYEDAISGLLSAVLGDSPRKGMYSVRTRADIPDFLAVPFP